MDRFNDHPVPQAIYLLKTDVGNELRSFDENFPQSGGDWFGIFLVHSLLKLISSDAI